MIFILIYIIISLFVMYHLVKYSFYFRSRHFVLTFFALGSVFLLVTNLLLFLSIDWMGIFSNLIA